MKTSWVLSKAPAMDIKIPVATWILARLYDEEHPIQRRSLMKNLCNASFDSMTSETDFGNTVKQLTDAKYIEYAVHEYTEHITIPNGVIALGSGTVQEIKRKREGYIITELGMYAYRKQIGTPLEKILPHVKKIPISSKTEKFKEIIETLKPDSELMGSAVKLCIKNAPLFLEFLKIVPSILQSIGINVQT